MRGNYRFVAAAGTVTCSIDGHSIELPMFMGVLKHPSVEQLRDLLLDPLIAGKYTREAIRKLPWNALRQFPRSWLVACLPGATLPEGRRRAVEFMLAM